MRAAGGVVGCELRVGVHDRRVNQRMTRSTRKEGSEGVRMGSRNTPGDVEEWAAKSDFGQKNLWRHVEDWVSKER